MPIRKIRLAAWVADQKGRGTLSLRTQAPRHSYHLLLRTLLIRTLLPYQTSHFLCLALQLASYFLIMSTINRTPSWVLETAEERATRLRNKVETDEERQVRLRKRVETLEERAARLRKNLTCGRWKREETLFKQVHELAMDFECEVYLIVQHHGEKDRQVYHSQPEKKEWVTDYQTLVSCSAAIMLENLLLICSA